MVRLLIIPCIIPEVSRKTGKEAVSTVMPLPEKPAVKSIYL